MCGIVGYVGEKEATPILINTLKKLEYRGYDSAGIAVLSENDNICTHLYKRPQLEKCFKSSKDRLAG